MGLDPLCPTCLTMSKDYNELRAPTTRVISSSSLPPPQAGDLRVATRYARFCRYCSGVLTESTHRMADYWLTVPDYVAVTTIAKPQMRGLLNSQIKKNLIVGLGLASVSAYIFKVTVADERRRKYTEFYRTYDAEKEFEAMRKKGVFQSC